MKAYGVFVDGKCVYKCVSKKRAQKEIEMYKPELKKKWFDTYWVLDAIKKAESIYGVDRALIEGRRAM